MARWQAAIGSAVLALAVLGACSGSDDDGARAGVNEARLLVNGLHDEDADEIVAWIRRVCEAFDERGLTDGYADLAAVNANAGGRGVDLDALVKVAVRYECPEYDLSDTR